MEEICWYRALCFSEPVGPWRRCKRQMRRDLMDRGLGSYDEWGTFFVTVPGNVQIKHEKIYSRAA